MRDEADFLLKDHPGLAVSWLSPRFVLPAVVSPDSFAYTPIIWQAPKIRGKQKRKLVCCDIKPIEQKSLKKKEFKEVPEEEITFP